MGENYRDDATAVSTASRMATSRARSKAERSQSRKGGSLALTALVVVGFLIVMLWAMIKFAP